MKKIIIHLFFYIISILFVSSVQAQKIPSRRVDPSKTATQQEATPDCPVVNINLSYEPGNLDAADCPVTITFKGEIVVNAPCYLQYRFVKNGELAGVTQYLNAPSAGNYNVTETEVFSEPSVGHNRVLEVIAPCSYRSARIKFDIKCPNLTKTNSEQYKYTPPETDTYSSPTGACCVSNVYLSADKVSHFGDCPVTINYRAIVTTNDRCIFQYQFFNGETPSSAVQTFIAQSSGNHEIKDSETIYRDEESKRTLRIISPCPTTSNAISIHTECKNR